MHISAPELAIVGQRLPRGDGIEKTTGEAIYVPDLKLPGLLVGKILPSPYPHALVRHVDGSRALRLPGVKAVLTGKDVPPTLFGTEREPQDKTVLALEKVRYVGDAVAAVAAVDEETAEEALELIQVEYEPLPSLFDPQAAMAPEAPLIHNVARNIAAHIQRHFGDVAQGFAEAEELFEDTFTTQAVAHCCLEPHGCAAQFDRSGRLTMWASTQKPHFLRESLAKVLGLPLTRIRVLCPKVGGAFGSKDIMEPREPVCALLALKTGRPVLLVNSRKEEFVSSGYRYPMQITLRSGVRRDGRLLAREATIITDNGAYNNQGTVITSNSGAKLSQLYAVPNIRFEAYVLYTNKPPGAAFRGFGGPQMHFAMESQMDLIAQRLGMDPLELRLRNANQPHSVTASGAVITSCALTECLQRAAEGIGWAHKRGRGQGRGVGLACMIHGGGGTRRPPLFVNFAEAFIKFNEDGTASLITGEGDVGQGSDTVLAQIAAEELGLPLEDMRLVSGDTDMTPLSLGTAATRVTFMGGRAVKMAAAEAKRQLLAVAAELLEANPEDLEARQGQLWVRGSPERGLTFREVIEAHFRRYGRPVTARGWYDAPNTAAPDPKTGYGNISPAYTFAAQAVEVEVDQETGQVRILSFVAAHDLGRAINPLLAEGQVEGAALQGTGYALMEHLVFQEGKALNPTFMDYRVPLALDAPPLQVHLVESLDPEGPFGAKGVGEPGLVPSAAAIANAVANAVGVRIKELPLTPERVLRALRAQGGSGG